MTTGAFQAEQTFDITARKVHQGACVLALAVAFILNGPLSPWLIGAVGIILAGGRFWWPLDLFRQLTWRVLEPVGIVRRREVVEDHSTRRVARVLGGIILLGAAGLLAVGALWAWLLVLAIGAMILLDAVFDFCVLCTLTHQFARATQR